MTFLLVAWCFCGMDAVTTRIEFIGPDAYGQCQARLAILIEAGDVDQGLCIDQQEATS